MSVSVPKPKREKSLTRRLQMTAPLETEAPTNLVTRPSDVLVDLNFKVPGPFHRAFKMEATLRGLSMKDMLVEMFDLYLKAKPREDEP